MNNSFKLVMAAICCLFLMSMQSCSLANLAVRGARATGRLFESDPADKQVDKAEKEGKVAVDNAEAKAEFSTAERKEAEKKNGADSPEANLARNAETGAKIALVQAKVDYLRKQIHLSETKRSELATNIKGSDADSKEVPVMQKQWQAIGKKIDTYDAQLQSTAKYYGQTLLGAPADYSDTLDIKLEPETDKIAPNDERLVPFLDKGKAKELAKPTSPATSPAPAPAGNMTQPATTPAVNATPATNPQPVPAVDSKSNGATATEAPASATPPVATPAQNNNTEATGNTPVASAAGKNAPETRPAGETPAAGDTKETDKKANEATLVALSSGSKVDVPPPPSGSSYIDWVWWLTVGLVSALGVVALYKIYKWFGAHEVRQQPVPKNT